MKQMRLAVIFLVGFALMGLVNAQDQKKKDGANNKDRQQQQRQRGNFQRGDWQKMVNDRIMQQYKTQVKVTDEEWTKLEPLIKDVMEKKSKVDGDAMGGLSRMFRGRQQQRPEQPKEGEEVTAEQKLRTALAENSPDPTIKDLMDAVRKEKEAALTALKEARKKLRLELSTKQEAEFMLNGLLD